MRITGGNAARRILKVTRCEAALNNLDAEDNKFIAGMLKSMLESPQR
jgi:hypothetical protein